MTPRPENDDERKFVGTSVDDDAPSYDDVIAANNAALDKKDKDDE